jgi:hypothetical protein
VVARSEFDAGALGTREILALLAQPHAYNLRVALDGDVLAVCAWLPQLPALQERRRSWLVSEVLETAARLGDVRAPRAQEDAPAAVAASLLESLGRVAERAGATAQPAGSASLRIESELQENAVVFGTASAEGLLLRGALGTPVAGSPWLRAARAHACLLLNGRLVFARVAPLDLEAEAFAVETRLPVDLDEDELACALEGVRWGLREAERTLRCLGSERVAAEYAEANELRVE